MRYLSHHFHLKDGLTYFIMKIILPLTLYLLIHCTLAAASEKKQRPLLKEDVLDIDGTHKKVSDTILLFTNRIDSFFGNRRGDEEANGSKLRIFFDHNIQEYVKDKSRVDMRMTLKLPQLEKLFQFKFNRDPKKEQILNQVKANSNSSSKLENILDIPYKLFQKWSYGISTGIKVAIPPDPYLRARLRRTIVFSGFEFNPTQSVSWYLKEGVGYSMSNDLDYKLADWGLFRLVNSLSWTDATDEILTTQGPNFFLPLSDKTAIQFYAYALGRNKPTYYIKQYSAGANYRKSIYSNWAFVSISPSISWPKTRNWNSVLSLNFRIEAVFGS